MKDYMYNAKKKEQYTLSSLNHLIYDYMVKLKFDKSAKIFAAEASIDDFKHSDGPPVLSQWYISFMEISNVRCGASSNPGDLSRIEGIMLKLENEKKRYQQMGRIDHTSYYSGQREQDQVFKNNEMYKNMNMYYPPNYYDSRKNMDLYNTGVHGPVNEPPMYNEHRKQPDYRNINIQPRAPRYEENVFEQQPSLKPNVRPDPRYDPKVKIPSNPISPKVFENKNEVSHIEKSFVLREVSSFKISDNVVLCSVISKEHNILFNLFSNRTLGAFNCNTMKNESIIETSGKLISEIRIKDFNEYIYIVAGYEGKELMVLRYIIKESKFDIAGYLRGHNSKIKTFDISDYIFSLDDTGIFRKWNFKGVCEREEILSANITHIFSFADNNLILSDLNRVFLYDFEMNMEMNELIKGELIDIKRYDDYYIFIFREKVCIYDNNLNKIKILTIPNNNIKTSCYVDNDIFIATQQTLWYEVHGRLNKVNIYEGSDIVALDNINKYKNSHMLSISSNGECKIMNKIYNE